jgi:FlaA1/EpsC-like NDP-sugar epimerase
MSPELSNNQNPPENPIRHTGPEDTLPSYTRRRMMRTAGAALVGAAAFAPKTTLAVESSASDTSPKTSLDLTGKSAIVTGAARGIGRTIALALANAGADVMAIDVAGPASPVVRYPSASREELDETVRLVQAQKRRCLPVIADIRDLDALRKATKQANQEFGKIDIVVANAAIQVYLPLVEITDQEWKDVIDVNLTGTANTIRAVLT